ncbi:MAG: hypothetical protein AAF810_17710 [Cyanobacteria bacterium P01_D01_bin.36]
MKSKITLLRTLLKEQAVQIRRVAEEAIAALNPNDFDETINWGDLSVTSIYLNTEAETAQFLVFIEEASDDACDFQCSIAIALAAQGFDCIVITQW